MQRYPPRAARLRPFHLRLFFSGALGAALRTDHASNRQGFPGRTRRQVRRELGRRLDELVELLVQDIETGGVQIQVDVQIPQILEVDRSLAQSSAYRNLAVLERAGVVHRIVTTDEFARYELAEDLTEHHHHLICRSCGSVADFTLDTVTSKMLMM